jgi:glycosyltransferase involved in cell wall biosynthesis
VILGLLPAIRGGIGELARTGQHARLVAGYLRPYARAFDEIRYFSYLDERLEQYTDDPEVLARARIYPAGRWHPWLYTLGMGFRHGRALKDCAVLRVFQISGAVPALVARRRFGVPFVTTYGFWYASLARTPLSRLLRRAVERLGLAAAAAVIVPTPELRAHVGRLTAPEKIRLIPNGVDTEAFRPVGRAPGRTRRVLYVGRLSSEKNLASLVEAVARLRGAPAVEVVLVGDGPERRALEALARARGVALTLRPFVPHDRLPEIFAGADAFVLPSSTEGHPKALLEAMACGLPCVASAVGGSRAILSDGDSGLLFEPGDDEGLRARLLTVLTQEDTARALGERARAVVQKSYDLAALVAEEIALLRAVGRGR